MAHYCSWCKVQTGFPSPSQCASCLCHQIHQTPLPPPSVSRYTGFLTAPPMDQLLLTSSPPSFTVLTSGICLISTQRAHLHPSDPGLSFIPQGITAHSTSGHVLQQEHNYPESDLGGCRAQVAKHGFYSLLHYSFDFYISYMCDFKRVLSSFCALVPSSAKMGVGRVLYLHLRFVVFRPVDGIFSYKGLGSKNFRCMVCVPFTHLCCCSAKTAIDNNP